MKNQFVLFIGLFVSCFGFSQTNNYWKKNDQSVLVQNENISVKKSTETLNENTYSLSVEKLKKVLSNCPKRFHSLGKSNVIITLPTEDGKFKEYRIKETSVLHPDLAKKFPDIKSYIGTSVNGEGGVVHFSLGHNNLKGMIMNPDAKLLHIKPSASNSKAYMVTSKIDESEEEFSCQPLGNIDEVSIKPAKKSSKAAKKDANDGRVRVYRMAIAVTAELSKVWTDKANVSNGSNQQKKAAVLVALNELMTRVNAIYERDLGTTFELVPNSDATIFLNGATDGITHGNTSASVNEGQGILDGAIGNANYDIGHVLDSAGAGRAALNSVCVDSKKAEGATGSDPESAYFFNTFVHEIGHQFGANHSFNNSCGGNRLDEGAVEPGSGSSIMSYARSSCTPQVDGVLYIFFNAKSIDEMWNHIVSTAGCGSTKSVGNSAPAANIGGNYTIPRSTPFVLEGSATDPNTTANQLTYAWNQMDKEIATMPPSPTSTSGPLFKYLPPSTSPNRYMPALSTIKTGNNSSEWEVVPSVSRAMNFRFTVRDNHPGGGNTDSKDAVITVSGTAGPFVVTSQNTRFDAPVGSTQTVTWNVAGTTGNGVNAATVDILLSTDGGNTYPISLASAVSNDGSHQITIPDNEGGVNRIMVRGTNNIFFDITNANFSITKGNSEPMPTNYCAAGSQGGNYIDEVIFGAINNKSGNSAYSDFTSLGTNVTKGQSVTLTVNPGIDFHDPNHFGAWIDWNKDGDFTDAGEEVLLKTNGPGGVTTTVVIPNTAKNGATRLRVRYRIHQSPEPCGTASTNGGEVEDYFVFIKGGSTNPGDTQAPTAPSNLRASNITQTTLRLNWNTSTDNVGVTGYDVYRENIKLGTVSGTSYTVSGLTANTAYSFSVRAKDAAGNQSASSNTVNATTTGTTNPTPTYCNAGRQGTNYIAQVTFGSISNTSQNGSYSNNTSQSTSVSKGTSVSLTVTPGIIASNWSSNVVGAWIDWNQDGDFTDAGERVLMKTPGVGGQTTIVVVPNNAKNGATRLRVRYRWGSNPNPCGTASADGDEVEDYTVNVGGGSPGDTQAPTAPSNLIATNITQTTLRLNWNTSTDNIGVTGYDVYRANIKLGTVSGASYNVSGLTANTAYSFSVRAKDAAGNESGASNTVNVTTTGTTNPTPTYCNAGRQGTNYIAQVTFGSISNTSQNGSYSNNTSQSTSVSKGSSVSLTVTPGIIASNWSSNVVGAWIDWNQDGDFTDTGERVLMKTPGVGGQTTTVVVPNNAKDGATRLRVRYRWGSNPNPCGTASVDGDEAEDYTVNVGGGSPGDTQAPTAPSNLRASNITQTTLRLNWNTSTDNIGVTGYDVYRANTKLGTVTGTTYNVTGLTANRSYAFSVRAKDAAGNQSGSSNVANATTTGTTTPTPTYCAMKGANNNDDYITNVNFAGINNTSAKATAGYHDYTAISGNVSKGASQNLRVTLVGWQGGGNNEVYAWFDWNKNGDFTDAGEKVNITTKTSDTVRELAINIPSNAASGTTRMRIVLGYNSGDGDSSCGSAAYGEVEDYNINISGTSAKFGNTDVTLSLLKSYPNPFNNNVTIDVSSLGENKFTLSVYNVLGKELLSKEYKSNPNKILLGKELKVTGNYLVKIKTTEKEETLRLVKMK